jgi:hypothetical protein
VGSSVPLIATSDNSLRGQADPFAKDLSALFDACFGFVGFWLGAGIGGIVGGIGGSVLGAGVAAQRLQKARTTEVPARRGESVDDELTRLKNKITQLEQERNDETADTSSTV